MSAEMARAPPPPRLTLMTPVAALVSVPLETVKFEANVLPVTDSSVMIPALVKLFVAVNVATPKGYELPAFVGPDTFDIMLKEPNEPLLPRAVEDCPKLLDERRPTLA